MTTTERDAAELRAHLEREARSVRDLPPIADAARRRGTQLRMRRRLTLGGTALVVAAMVGGIGLIADQRTDARLDVAARSESVALPVMTDPDGVKVQFQAGMGGQLLISEDGCPTIVRDGDGVEVAVVWPKGWTARIGDRGKWEVVDPSGTLRATDGDLISAGGGPSYWDEETCSPELSSVRRVHNLDVQPPRKTAPAPNLDIMVVPSNSGAHELARIQGTVQLGSEAGCPGLDVQGEFVPVVWPAGWSVRPESSNETALVDESGAVVARTGDEVALGGGYVGPTASWNEHPCATSEPWAGYLLDVTEP